MEDISENKQNNNKKHICAALLAHVDAGKTTLAESLLYLGGRLRKLGRVDHGDAFLDTYELERSRGITIFSKQARLMIGDKAVTLLDTPGHVDFSAEMERTLQVLDYAILIINGADGVQSHVKTLWKLLLRYEIPVFLFVNKMDQQGTNRTALMTELKQCLSENCIDFTESLSQAPGEEGCEAVQNFQEELALCDEMVMEQYLNGETIEVGQITAMIKARKVFPCYFGSALKLQGIEALIQGFSAYTEYRTYPKAFGARVFKISRDEQGNRLTHMKITGGTLQVKTLLKGQGDTWQEKVNQLRIYSGPEYELQQEVAAGDICAVTGLTQTFIGEGLGIEETVNLPVLEPVLNYRMILPEDCPVPVLLRQLRQMEEEEPLLHILWEEESGEIQVQLMGEVQIEVLKTMIKERFGVAADFDSGSIVYKETLAEPVEGVGHFEPLRHYAEVHLLMEPGEPGSGLQIAADCQDMLDRNWQRLILTHLKEKKHRGVLIGAEITDIKITLVAGRAHPKHTEGGDFRQATYRAVRQGLKMGKCLLLEPVYEYRLELPTGMVGRAMTDIQKMHGKCATPMQQGEMSVITGTAPAATMQGYQTEVLSYTKGSGRLFCTLKGYEPCHNEEEIIAAKGYDSERDLENPTGSVFCAHGAGFVVDYSQVYEYMHLEGRLVKKKTEASQGNASLDPEANVRHSYVAAAADEEELEAIFKRTYGEKKQTQGGRGKKVIAKGANAPKEEDRKDGGVPPDSRKGKGKKKPSEEKEYLLVDGYNIIFSWEELNQLAQVDMGAARGRLMDILSNYQGYKKNTLILVFDAYKVPGNPGEMQKYHNIYVVYTKEAETADQYIEKATHEIGRKYKVTVATSDGLEQLIILGQGAGRMSARGLKEEIEAVAVQIQKEFGQQNMAGYKNYLGEHLPERGVE